MNTEILKRTLPLVIIFILLGLAWLLGITDYINLETIKSHRGDLLDLVQSHRLLSIAGFTAVYILAVALSLPIATLLTLVGGFLFGRWAGTLMIVIAATCGASLLFLAARSAIGTALREKAGPLYTKVESNMRQNAVGYMLFMRLVPLFPFFLVNIVPAMFNVRLVPYVVTTFVGIIPGTFIYANVGRELGTINTLGELASPQILIAFSLLGVFALLPTLYKQFKSNNNLNSSGPGP